MSVSSRDDVLLLISSDSVLSKIWQHVQSQPNDDPGHDTSHVLRVALWTLRILESEGALTPESQRQAIAAALMHDIVNVPKNSPNRARASELCAEEAGRLLTSFDFGSESSIALVKHAIRDHSYSRGAVPDSVLGRALQDADRLEALGVLGIMRLVSTGTRMGARYFHDVDPWAANRTLDDHAYSVDHFFTKLLKLEHTMLTTEGRREAHVRTETLRAFLADLARELGVAIPSTRPQ